MGVSDILIAGTCFHTLTGPTDTKYCKAILKEDDSYVSKLKIPDYQRDYRWEPSIIETLMQDIYEHALDDERADYFMGAVGMQADAGQFQFKIVDGQQRIVALTLLSIALRDHCFKHGFYSLGWNIHKLMISKEGSNTDFKVEAKSVKKNDINEDLNILKLLCHISSGLPLRFYPTNQLTFKLTYLRLQADDPEDPSALETSNYAIFHADNVSYEIMQGTQITFPDSTTTITLDAALEIDDEASEITVPVSVNAEDPTPIQPGDCSESLVFNEHDLEFKLKEEFGGVNTNRGRRPHQHYKRARIFLNEDIWTPIEQNDELGGDAKTTQHKNELSKVLHTMKKLRFSVTRFVDLDDALDFFSKVNDKIYSRPLSPTDLVNHQVVRWTKEGEADAESFDELLGNDTETPIEDQVKLIVEKWNKVKEILVQSSGKDEHKFSDKLLFYYMLSRGLRKAEKKSRKWVVDRIKSAYETAEEDAIQAEEKKLAKYKAIVKSLNELVEDAELYNRIAVAQPQNNRELRLKFILRSPLTQHIPLVISAFRRIRKLAKINDDTVNMDSDEDYKTNLSDYHDLEIQVIDAVELYLARAVLLVHEDDVGIASNQFYSQVITYVNIIEQSEETLEAIQTAISLIEDGGTETLILPDQWSDQAAQEHQIQGLKPWITNRTPKFYAEDGTVSENIRDKELSNNHGTFLLWFIERTLRESYGEMPANLHDLVTAKSKSLEHIVPQSAYKGVVDEWDWWDPADNNVENLHEVQAYVKKLGNMCLLKKIYNISLGNRGFTHKRTVGNPDEGYPHYDTLSQHWIIMKDIASTADPAVLGADPVFGDEGEYAITHMDTLPVGDWTITEIDNRNSWLFSILGKTLKLEVDDEEE